MSTQVQAQVSKRDTVVLGGNMALRRGLGGGSVTMVLRRQLSPISSVELLAIVGLRSILRCRLLGICSLCWKCRLLLLAERKQWIGCCSRATSVFCCGFCAREEPWYGGGGVEAVWLCGRRQLSTHSTGTSGLSVSLRDGSVTLANTWSRQLSEDTTGNVSVGIPRRGAS
jgi:hypothetical protein